MSSPSNDNPVVIVSAARTPIGKFNGGLSSLSAAQLGTIAITAALDRAKVAANEVDEVIMGHVLTGGTGQGPARQAAINAGIRPEATALTINQICGSGLRALAFGYNALAMGDADIEVAGGQESMSGSPHAMHLRNGTKMGNGAMIDTMIQDGLWDAFNDYHMGITAENIAEQWQITRDEQDRFAVTSQNRAEAAIKAGKFDAEIVPVTIKGRHEDTVIAMDEFPRAGATLEMMAGLKPAFKKDGTVTAGNASGINDGAAAMVMMRADEAEKRSLTPLVRIVSWATAGVDPSIMGMGPVPASKKALERAGWSVSDLNLVEANEAFAAQACAVVRDLGLDPEIVNVNGGAIALGHPIGASGARVATTLIHEMQKRDVQKGLATLCIGGGMGIAMCFEKI